MGCQGGLSGGPGPVWEGKSDREQVKEKADAQTAASQRRGATGSEGLVESVEMVTAGGDDPTGPRHSNFSKAWLLGEGRQDKKLIHNINSRDTSFWD